jgi:hypothetical protein
MNTSLKAILVTTATAFSLAAYAADTTVAPSHEAKDLKTESKADYKARKNITEAQKELDLADCKTSGLESKDERDCKKSAKDAAKDAKHHAKEIHKQEKADIKAQTN